MLAKPVKEPKLEFFAARLQPQRVRGILEAVFHDKDPETARFYRQLSQTRRIQAEFHVTLIHRASQQQHQEQWKSLEQLHSSIFAPAFQKFKHSDADGALEPEIGACQVQLERIVWDNRLMCFVVRLLPSEGGEAFETVNPVAHVTVGTASQSIKPKESNDLLQRWLSVGSGGATGIWEEKVQGNVLLEGSVRGVLQKF